MYIQCDYCASFLIQRRTYSERLCSSAAVVVYKRQYLKNLEPSRRNELDSLLGVLSKALLHDFKLCILPLQDQALIVLVTALTHHA